MRTFIADRAEQSAEWRAEADIIENEIADEAERILTRFVSPVEILHLSPLTEG